MVYTKEFKELLAFEYPCYICGNILSRAKQSIDHVQRIHGYILPTRQVGRRRPPDPQYEYQNDINGEYDVVHYSCSSCWYHCPESGLADLSDHINRTHNPVNVDPSKNDHGDIHGAEVNERQLEMEIESEGSREEMVQASEKYKESGHALQKVQISHRPKSLSATEGVHNSSNGLDTIEEKEPQELLHLLNEITSRFKKLFEK